MLSAVLAIWHATASTRRNLVMRNSLKCLIGQFVSAATMLAIAASASPAHADTSHSGKTVQYIQSPGTAGGCAYFTLNGVSEADPSVPGNAWFAVPVTHPGFKEIMMLLAAAKLSDKWVNVRTTSSTACGYAAVEYVFM